MAWADAEDERDVSGAVGEKGPTWLPVVGQFGIKHPPQLHIPHHFSYDGLVSRLQLFASGYHPSVGGSGQR
jgi:hypothetical protein